MKFFTDYTNLLLLAVAIVSGLLLAWPKLSRRGRGIAVTEATQLINRRNALIVDVRDAAAYQSGHLPQARHLPFEEVSAKAPQFAKNKNHPVLLVDENGRRAAQAEALFKNAGYAEVFVLQGGLVGWRQAGMPIVKSGVAK
ncbi:rhodanese-like domain-containing protein [Chitinasiproducens palmae]|uniref:Rhodanese-related sulfurtransferase n=1 Tax=Chitinasiproducens palmae TaxID=1770053 RepID=A0A1H2PNI7_9BURK|nr:rhodanese-like domain-containing protein [Chitinasiproducens palmae]SDV48251.1 Rhodanese-related sulfurtransferase [Chitinasiproducens palmae]